MVMFNTLDGNAIYLREDSIDGAYVKYYENTCMWTVNLYVRGQKLCYSIDKETADSIRNYFYKRKKVRL